MPILGRYGNTSGRPYVEGRLILPRLSISADLSFLLDTGADAVFVMPGDSLLMGVDYAKLVLAPAVSLGVGGETQDFIEPGVLVFTDGAALYLYDLPVNIGHLDPKLFSIPSLLGRSVIDNWSITYSPADGVLSADVRAASLTIPPPAGFNPITPANRRD